MEVRDGVSVVPQVEGEVSVMASGSTDNDTAKTDSEIELLYLFPISDLFMIWVTF